MVYRGFCSFPVGYQHQTQVITMRSLLNFGDTTQGRYGVVLIFYIEFSVEIYCLSSYFRIGTQRLSDGSAARQSHSTASPGGELR
mmetsp:Transcript_9335/g.28131  ORF Transcript_9335/g.28131 Transcript_9335/m.28131 type:complete len:85 (+) Transcript_9335:910-1164(+)